MQPVQNPRQCFHRLRTVPACIVQQNHAAITPLLFHSPQDDVRSGLRPILRVDTFQNHEIIEVLGDFQRSQFAQLRWTRISRIRRAKQRRGATCYCFKQKLRRVQLQADVLRPAERQVWMIVGVVSDLVSFIDDATNKPGVTFRIHSHQEKRRFYVRGFKNVQDLWRPSRIGSVIKSDCDLMLAACALVIERRELGKLHVLRSEIALCVHGESSNPVRAIFVNSDNLAVANVCYRIRRLYQLDRLSRLIVEVEISPNA